MSLPGPSRTIIVEPVERPASPPAEPVPAEPDQLPDPAEPVAPEREEEPARSGA